MIGLTISHYRILEKLGEGGMGIVYKAQDLKLDRLVALKFLPPHLAASPADKTRFIHEAKAASALDHPNICTIHEVGETDDGQLFIVMPYYDGGTLKDKIAHGSLPVDESIDIALQVTRGLAKAQAGEITHRDIKPGNIVFTNDRVAKIVDFGLAKLSGRTKVTRTGATVGTIAYMSPEQARGDSVDYRTDIWSLGVIMYEMLSGALPFKSDYEQAVVYSILNEKPCPVSELQTGTPKELEAIVQKCLEKEPAARYQDAHELLVDLNKLKGTPIPLSLTTSKMRARVIPAVATLTIIFAAAMYFLFFGAPGEAKKRVRIAVADVVNETKEENLNGLSGLFMTAFEQSPSLTVLTRSSMFDALRRMGKGDVETIDEQAAKDVCNYAGVNALLTVSIRKLGQRYIMDLKVLDPQKDEHLFAVVEESADQDQIYSMINRLSVKARRATFEEDEAQIQMTSRNVAEMTTGNLDAYQHYFQGLQLLHKLRYDDAKQEFERAVALDTTFALAYYRLAYVRSWIGMPGVWPAIDAALRHINQVPDRDKLMIKAFNAAKKGGTDEAIAAYHEIVDNYPDEKDGPFELGDMLFHYKTLADSALPYFERAISLDPQAFGEAYHHTVMISRVLGFNDKALEYAKQFVAFLPSEEAYLQLALTYNWRGEFQEAMKLYETTQKLYPNSPRPTVGTSFSYILMGEYGKAETELKKLLHKSRPAKTKNVGYETLAFVYAYLGRYQEALRMNNENLKIASTLSDSLGLATCHIARAYWLTVGNKNKKEAAKALEKAFSIVSARAEVRSVRIVTCVSMGEYETAVRMTRNDGFYGPYVQAALLRSKGEYSTAILEFEQMRMYPQVHYSFQRAELYYEAGRYDDALQMAERMLTYYPSPAPPVIDYVRAANYPRNFLLLGKIHEKKGNIKLAIENYEKFLDLWKDADKDLPELAEAKMKLGMLKQR